MKQGEAPSPDVDAAVMRPLMPRVKLTSRRPARVGFWRSSRS